MLLLFFNPRSERVDDIEGGFSFGGAGSAPTRILHAVQGDGGFRWGGSTPTAYRRSINGTTGSGGWQFGGSRCAQTWGIKPTGGWKFGAGSPSAVGIKNATTTGGFYFGGEGPARGMAYTPSGRGGWIFGGGSPGVTINKGLNAGSPAGGFSFGGSSTAVARARIAPDLSGGWQFGGATTRGVGSAPRPVGGFAFGGDPAVRAMRPAIPSGGWQFGGSRAVYGSTPVVLQRFSGSTSAAGGFSFGGFGNQVSFFFAATGQTVSYGTDRDRGATTQSAILRAIRARIIDTGVLLQNQVFVEFDPVEAEKTNPAADFIAAIMPSSKVVDQGQLEAGGTDADTRTEVVQIRVYARLSVDRVGQRTEWSSSETRGGYARARRIASKFQVHDLRDGSGTIIVAEPTRVVQIGDPNGQRNGWGFVPVYIEVKYTEAAP